MARPIAAVALTLGCLQASAVYALGLGDLTLDSFLNQPFKARVNLLNTEGLSDHQIRIRLATTDDFDRMGVDRAYFLTSMTFEVEIDDSGRGQIILSSEAPVLEPFLDFIVEARWPTGRLLREYTVLVDPPVFDSSQTVTISASKIADAAEENVEVKKKTSATSGTSVKLGESKLPAGEMPKRNFGSDASEQPLPGDRYMIRRDETLWSIAKKSKPEGASISQTMLDIQRLNPKAFIGGNINRIKAGYIIYLPSSGDISSDDLASAEREVKQQNQDWRDNVSSSGRSSLRISTGTTSDERAADSMTGSSTGSAAEIASREGLDRSERDLADVEQRLDAMSEQVDTLERIVSVKDEQIAALQNALAEATASADTQTDSAITADMGTEPVASLSELDDAVSTVDSEAEAAVDAQAEPESAAKPEPAPAVEAPAPVATPPKEVAQEGGFFSNIYYMGGLLLALIIGVVVFMRRRSDDAEEEVEETDVFADIQLEEQPLEVVADTEPEADAPDPAPEEDSEEQKPGSRGYGERKNDEYASDVDSVDTLAEADIYIAYGRFPQAVDLLKTAITSESANPAYKLKLMEVSSEMGDHVELMKQYGDVKSLGNADALSRADEILRENDGTAVAQPSTESPASLDNPLDLSDDLDLDLEISDLELDSGADNIDLEDEFGELEIEGFESELTEDDLDLTKEFADEADDTVFDDAEQMVFAADGDPVSTKLDLARAYLDMGDQDGARGIFEEIVVEGNAEQKQEALAQLERLA